MLRRDGRAPDALRPVRFTRDYLKHAHGSCMIEQGDTRVLCAANVLEGVSQWRRGRDLGWVTAEYAMLPASTHTRTRREAASGGQVGRTHEIQRLIGRALRAVVDMSGLGGEHTLQVDCDVIQADGGTRTAAITGAFIAVHDALTTWKDAGKISSIPITDHVAAVSVGVVDGEMLMDLDYEEDSIAEVDMNVVLDGAGRFVEVQGTAEAAPFERSRLDDLLDLATEGAQQLIEVQRQVLAQARSHG